MVKAPVKLEMGLPNPVPSTIFGPAELSEKSSLNESAPWEAAVRPAMSRQHLSVFSFIEVTGYIFLGEVCR